MKRVSVVIPAGELDSWLDEAVGSVLASDYPDIELIVVANGADTTKSPTWATDQRVRLLVFPKRLGPVGATLEGLANATGEYYVRLDADDLMSSTRIRRQVEYLEANPDTAVVGSRVGFINEHGENIGAFRLPVGSDVRRQLVGLNVVPHSSLAARMGDVLRVGSYNPDLEQMEDYDLLLRLALGGAVAILDSEEVSYRRHTGQISKSVLPWGPYIATVMEARSRLAAHIGVGRIELAIKNARWMYLQYLQYFGRGLQARLVP